MTFDENFQVDTGRERRSSGGGGRSPRGMGPGMKIGGGGGILGVVILIIIVLVGGNPSDLLGGSSPAGGGGLSNSRFTDVDTSQCNEPNSANKYVNCRVIGTMQSLDAVWDAQDAKLGFTYDQPGLDLFEDRVNTACGAASSAMGPFYCPADKTVYIDTGFFDELTTKFGANGGNLAQMYVVAHEVGHHISNQIGTIGRAQQDPKGPQSGAVRVELQADCFGGIWAHHAANTPDPKTGQRILKPLTEQDIKDALSAAAAVGDDRIQQKVQGRVNPEAWTHGSADQRMKWFYAGYRSGDPNTCDTFRGNV